MAFEEDIERQQWVQRDAVFRVRTLDAANRGVVLVTPDDTITHAVTLLLQHDFSQLPVMTGERTLLGVINWRSLGTRLSLGQQPDHVKEAMERAQTILADASIFEAIPLIVQSDYVLVRGEQNKITGIVTASDMSVEFRKLSEPFLLLSETENILRNMIGAKFDVAALAAARDPNAADREVNSVDDLAFGEYVRLLQDPLRWPTLEINLDRTLFCSYLDTVRIIRNDVMHFNPDGPKPEDLEKLRAFSRFLKSLADVTR